MQGWAGFCDDTKITTRIVHTKLNKLKILIEIEMLNYLDIRYACEIKKG